MKEVFQFLFPGLMLMWLCFIANGVFSDIFAEYRSHTLARMVGSGVTVAEFIVSKMLRCLVVCWICELILILFTRLVFDLPWRRPVVLFGVLTSFNVFVLGLLSLIYGYARSTDLANGITVFVFLISGTVGGSFVPYRELPATLQTLGQWSMIRLANVGIEGLFQSRSLWEVLRPSLLLLFAGLVLTWLGVAVLKRRFTSGGLL